MQRACICVRAQCIFANMYVHIDIYIYIYKYFLFTVILRPVARDMLHVTRMIGGFVLAVVLDQLSNF